MSTVGTLQYACFELHKTATIKQNRCSVLVDALYKGDAYRGKYFERTFGNGTGTWQKMYGQFLYSVLFQKSSFVLCVLKVWKHTSQNCEVIPLTLM